MQVRFWGTRGSIAKAGPTTVRYGGNTSCVEVRSDSGTVVVLDCGTGAHGLGAALVKDPQRARRGHMLISHTHWDHIQGMPFFAPLFVPGNEWHLYGPQGIGRSLQDALAGQMEYTYFPITPDQFAADVGYHDLVEGSFDLGDIRVTARYLNHPALTLGYKLEVDGVTLVYATDHEPHSCRLAHGGEPAPGSEDELHGQFIADADLLIHDTQYTSEEYADHTGWGHSTVEYVTDLSARAAVRRLALFHHDPMRDDDQLDALVERSRTRARTRNGKMEVIGAAESAAIELRRRAQPMRRPITTRESAFAVVDDRQLSVLLVAPLGRMLDTLVAAVRADGHELHTAPTAGEAGALVTSTLHGTRAPSLVMLAESADVRPLAALVGGLPPKTAVVMLTDAAVPVSEGGGSESGAATRVTRWLVWPFSEAYARARIRSWGNRLDCRWREAPIPSDEPSRQAALEALGVLDTPPEPRFDRHVRITRSALGAGSAMINLIDGDRQWTKALDRPLMPVLPRDMSFCAHVLHRDDVLQVPDCARDPAFADHPAVRGNPWIRFYAGAPLRLSDGAVVGALCIVDIKPRHLTESERSMLMDLAVLVVDELERDTG